MRKFLVCIFACILMLQSYVKSQDSVNVADRILNVPDKIFSALSNKSRKIELSLARQSEKYLRKMAAKEQKLEKKLSRLDSNAASRTFAHSQAQYQALIEKVRGISQDAAMGGSYIPHLDSMSTCLSFLNQSNLLGKNAEIEKKLASTLAGYKNLKGKFGQTEEITRFLVERRQAIEAEFNKLGLTKELRKYQKDLYYYKAQVEEYREALRDANKLEKKLLDIANRFPSFRDFFHKHSELATLFNLPGTDPSSAILTQGLQTRTMVLQDLQFRFGSGPDFQQQLNQGLSAAQSQLSQLRNKINQLGGNGGGDLTMPDFRPNQQKTKTVWRRIETGFNVQSTKNNYFFPVTTDIGLNAGYKLNDKSTIGLGVAYKMGWGRDIRHIAISHQGVGFRSYADIKLKGSFWISGGAELNYRSEFKSFDVLRNLNPWQRAALLGISKKYVIGKKLKGNVQLLYDFLARQGIESPLKFRTGYNF